jgi:arsenite methyltransferase
MEQVLPRFDIDRLRQAIQQEYREVAVNPACGFHFISGRPLAERLGYPEELLALLPPAAVASFAGTGNPFAVGPIRLGETVLDVGSGAGTDALTAALQAGPEGKVIGVDMTPEMLARAEENAHTLGVKNVRFVQGFAEALPLPDASVDVVISNGVINLCPDKPAVFAELYRVLKPGGRLQLADTLLDQPVSPYARDLIHLWTDCVAGGVTVQDYVAMLRAAGFRDVAVAGSYDTFRDAPVEATADRYGARGANVRGRKPSTPS